MYQDLFSLNDRVIIVTGGAGHLGAEISRGLAAFGARVVVVGRDKTHFDELLRHDTFESGGRIECHACDVSDDQAFAELVERTWRDHGRIDALINNAASGARQKWEALDKSEWLKGLEENGLHHYFTCTKIVGEYLLAAGRGAIVNNASLWSFLAPDFKVYLDLNNEPSVHAAVAKGGIVQMTRYLAALWGPKGVRVNAFTPGWFPKRRGPDRPDYLREITSRVPAGRIGTPSDIVGVVVFLVSDASAYMTGQNVVVDGGYSIW